MVAVYEDACSEQFVGKLQSLVDDGGAFLFTVALSRCGGTKEWLLVKCDDSLAKAILYFQRHPQAIVVVHDLLDVCTSSNAKLKALVPDRSGNLTLGAY